MKPKKPTRSKFYLADDIKVGQAKPIIFGLYPDDRIVVDIDEGALPPSVDKPAQINDLAIMATFINCAGQYLVNAKLVGPTGHVSLDTNQKYTYEIKSDNQEKSNININLGLRPFVIFAPGKYTLTVELDKFNYEYIFEVLYRVRKSK